MPEPVAATRKPAGRARSRPSEATAAATARGQGGSSQRGASRAGRHLAPLAVFCDFDGTFSVQDIGATLAQRHRGDRRPAMWTRFERGEITAWEYNLEILDGLELPLPALDEFLRSVELDPGARELLAWCAVHDVPFRILSDGFDLNLDRLQDIHNVRFDYSANRLRYEDGCWRIECGYPNPDCECGTGTCKARLIEAFRREHPGTRLVHIGNGWVSDTCGALAADVAFAKDTLLEELERRGHPFECFHTLRDVIPILERMRAREEHRGAKASVVRTAGPSTSDR